MELSSPPNSLVFHPQGKLLATAGLDYAARLWDVARGREILRVPHENLVFSLSFDRDGHYLATASADNSVRVAAIRPEDAALPWEGPKMTAAAYSSRGDYVATGDQHGWVRLWSIDSQQLSMQLQVQGGKRINRLLFNPDDSLLAAADVQGGFHIINVNSRTETNGLNAGAAVKGIAFSPDGKYLATGGSDHQARLCTATGANCRTFEQADEVNGLAFSPDSQRLALTTGSFGKVHHNGYAVWDLQSRRITLELKDQSDPFEAVSFSKDGRYIVTTGQDFTARIWVQNSQ